MRSNAKAKLTEQQSEDARTSKRILDLAREQQDEIAREIGGDGDEWEDENEGESHVPSTSGHGARHANLFRSFRRPDAPDMSDEEETFDDGNMSGGEEYAELVS